VGVATEVWRLSPAWLRYIPNGIDLRLFGDAGGSGFPGEGLMWPRCGRQKTCRG
jgi:hypothetical protein